MKEWITGRNAVYEVLSAHHRDLFRIQIADGAKVEGRLAEIVDLARARKLDIASVSRKKLDLLDENHQGVALEAAGYHYSDIDEILAVAKKSGEPLFILLLDVIQNPQNLGTLVRTAAAAGMHGIIMPQAKAAGVTPAVVHASVGSTEHIRIAQMNLSQAIDTLHKEGAWVIGLEGGEGTKPVQPGRLGGNLGIVVGSEGEGLRQLTRRQCDELTALPMSGKIESLNAAVAGSIVIYLSYLQRLSSANPPVKVGTKEGV